jgi:DNA-directed RNA polymerase II subunit RPB1
MVQDTLTGAFRISNPKTRIPEHVVMNIMAKLRRPLASFVPTGEEHTGMNVISAAFPLMNFSERVTIENGKLVKGLLKKGAFNTTSEGVLHVLFNDFGPQRCGQFINEVQSIVTKFNMYTGFSTGASDLVSNEETVQFVAATLAEGRRRVQEILTDVHAGRFVNISGRTDGEELENQINNTLKDISAKITDRVSETLPRENRLVQMVESGAKGSSLNITQMIALLGQQIIDGKRVQYTLKDRSLPHFTKFDDGIESRGFVESSFVQGLRPAEYFFHAMGGREGLIDTAVKTSDTGYIQRQMMKTMEDMHAAYDGTVRNNTGVIIQYRYGEDGVDSTQVESQPIDLALLTLEEIYRRYALTPADVAAVSEAADGSQPPDLVDEIVRDRDMLVNEVFSHNKKSGVLAPVHLKRLIDGYRNPYSTKTDLTAAYVVEELTKLIKEPYMVQNRLFHCLLRFYLAPRRCILEYRMTQKIFDEVVKDVRYRYIKSLVHPGEMVGALAAQSIGEPTTQLTLNTFHSAGTVKAGATQGVPRIKELLGVSRNPKKPLCFAYLAPEMSTNLDHAIMMIREIQQTTVRDITKSVRMYYDPFPLTTDTKVAEDREILQSYQAFSATNARDCVSPWIMRLEFDETAMASRSIQDMVAIQDALIAQGDVARCVYSDTNADKLMMRIVFSPDVVKNMLTLRYMEERILDVVISGVDGVQGVYQRDVNKEMTWDDSINGYVSKKQHVLDVEGSGILYSLLAFPNVDPTRTFSNDIHEVMDVFGIEAARQALYDEFWEVLSAAYVNYHHMSVLLDAMTYQGRLVSVDRFGMGKHDNGVLAKSSFEETSRILFNAAVSSEFDPMKGVSANIMFGQKAPCGTGMVEILLDETRLPEGEEEIFQDYREQQPSAPAPVSDSGTECRVEDINMW